MMTLRWLPPELEQSISDSALRLTPPRSCVPSFSSEAPAFGALNLKLNNYCARAGPDQRIEELELGGVQLLELVIPSGACKIR
jgi:hypothetical protein